MKFKKLIAIQNAKIKREFNKGDGISLTYDRSFTDLLEKYLGKNVYIKIKKRKVLISHEKGYWENTSPIIYLNIKTKLQKSKTYSWDKTLSVYKLEPTKNAEEFVNKDISTLKKYLLKETKENEKYLNDERTKDLNKFNAELKKYKLSYKEFEHLKFLEKEVNGDYLKKLK